MDQDQADRIRRYVHRTAWYRYQLPSEVADDISQNILVLVWRLFPNEQPSEKWIYRAAHLSCLQMFRGERRRRQREEEFARRQVLKAATGSNSCERKLDLKMAVEAAVGHILGPACDLTGTNVADLAATYSVPSGTLYRRLWQRRRSGTSPPTRARRDRNPRA